LLQHLASESDTHMAVALLLDPVPDRRWVVAACANFCAADASVAVVRAVLAYGLQETQSRCATASASTQRLVADDALFFFTRARLQLLSAMERVDTLTAIHGGGAASGAGAAYEALRDSSSALEVALAFAAVGMCRGVGTVLARHPHALAAVASQQGTGEEIPWWRLVLDAFPMTLSPDLYADVLPWAPAMRAAREPAFTREADWAEQTDVVTALWSFGGSDALKKSASWLIHATEHIAAIAHAGREVYTPSAVEAASWVLARSRAIDASSGQTQHVIALLKHAMDGIPRMPPPHGDNVDRLASLMAQVFSLHTAACDLWDALSCAVPADEVNLAAGAWEHATCHDVASLDENARLDLLLSGATPGTVLDRVTRIMISLRARIGETAAFQAMTAWTTRASCAGRIECVAALFADLQESQQANTVFGSADAAARAGMDALFASPRTEASALDAASQLALALPPSTSATVIVSATRLLASHGLAPTLQRVRAACTDSVAATDMLRGLCSRFARRQPQPSDTAWHALCQDLRDIQAGAFAQCMSATEVLAVFLQFGPLACGSTHVAKRYLPTSSTAQSGAVLPVQEAELVVYAAIETLLRDAGDDADTALDQASDALDLIAGACPRAAADMDAIHAYRTIMPQLNVTNVTPAQLFGGDRVSIVHAVLDGIPPADVHGCAGPILALSRRLGLSNTQQRCGVELALAERAMLSVTDDTASDSLALARDLCIALARRGYTYAASLAGHVATHAHTPSDAARELLAFALASERDELSLPTLLDAWIELQGACDGAEVEDEDGVVENSTTGGAQHGKLPLTGASAAAFTAWREAQAPSDDVCYMLCADIKGADMPHRDGDTDDSLADDPYVTLMLALAPTAAPTAAIAAHGTGAALRTAMTSHVLRAATASGCLDHAALGKPALELAAVLEARSDLPAEARTQLASARALHSKGDTTAGAAALARAAPDIVSDARVFASGDAAFRGQMLMDVVTKSLELDSASQVSRTALPPRLAAALSMVQTTDLKPMDLLSVRLQALLSCPHAAADERIVAAHVDCICTALASNVDDAKTTVGCLRTNIFTQLVQPSAPLHPRICTYFSALASLYTCFDAAAAQRTRTVARVLRENVFNSGAKPVVGFQDVHGDAIALFVSSDGGQPEHGAERALARVAHASGKGAAYVASIARLVAALPCPPVGLSPAACVSVATWCTLLRPGGTWEAAKEALTCIPGSVNASDVSAALLPFIIQYGPGTTPMDPKLLHIAAGDAGEAAVKKVRASMGLHVRRHMLEFALSAADGSPDDALLHRLRDTSTRFDAASAAMDALKGWSNAQLCDAWERAAFIDDAKEKSQQLVDALQIAVSSGSTTPFSALVTASEALAAPGPDTVLTAIMASVSDACAALVSRRDNALLRAVVTCLTDRPAEGGADALNMARNLVRDELTRFGESDMTPPAAKVAVLEVLTAIDGGIAWPGWAAPKVEEAPVEQHVAEPKREVVHVSETQHPAREDAHAQDGAGDDTGDGWTDVDVELPVEETNTDETPAPAPAPLPPPPPPPPPAVEIQHVRAAEPPVAVAAPAAPRFDASVALLAARTAALVESLPGGFAVAAHDVSSINAAIALFARILDAWDRAVVESSGEMVQMPMQVLALWERSVAWAQLNGHHSTPRVPRPLHALWAMTAQRCLSRTSTSVAFMAAADTAAAEMPHAALLDADEAAQGVSQHADKPSIVAAASVALLCGHADVSQTAIEALIAAASRDGASMCLDLRCATLLIACGALDVVIASPQGVQLLARLCAACGDAYDNASSSVTDQETALALLAHIAAALTHEKRVPAAAAVALKATRTHMGLVSLDAGIALLPRFLRAQAGSAPAGKPALPGGGQGSTAALKALRLALPGVCRSAHDALASAMTQ